MSTIYLAFSPGGEARRTYPTLDWDALKINMLVSYFYLEDYRKCKCSPAQRVLDSGAYSAYHSGATIDIHALIKETKSPEWHESVCLDVIKDEKASIKNSLYMQQQGSSAFPVFHIGESWETLALYCKHFKKVGLAPRQGINRMQWVSQCFAKCWPKPFHLFGWLSKEMLTKFPFHSADSTTWALGPTTLGDWNAFPGGSRASVRGVSTLEAEIRHWLKFEKFLKARWKKELSRWRQAIK